MKKTLGSGHGHGHGHGPAARRLRRRVDRARRDHWEQGRELTVALVGGAVKG